MDSDTQETIGCLAGGCAIIVGNLLLLAVSVWVVVVVLRWMGVL